MHVHITGRVQGVSFRAWTCERARELGISGWARNRSNGSVEGLVSGSSEAVETLIAALHEGPPAAEVKDVRATETETHAESGFRIHG
nr:acylphosphatase [Primorskyibacter marinus]